MTTPALVEKIITTEFWRHGLIVDSNSMDRMTLRVYVANQSRIIAAHARSELRGHWLYDKLLLLVAGAVPASVFHFNLMAVANSIPSIGKRDLNQMVAVVRALRTQMQHSSEDVTQVLVQGYSYHKDHPCTHEAAGKDTSYITERARFLAQNWF